MTLQEAINALAAAYPKRNVCIDFECWINPHRTAPELKFHVWAGDHHEGPSLDEAVQKALGALREVSVLNVGEAEPVVTEAAALVPTSV